jgi:hypothetical protein
VVGAVHLVSSFVPASLQEEVCRRWVAALDCFVLCCMRLCCLSLRLAVSPTLHFGCRLTGESVSQALLVQRFRDLASKLDAASLKVLLAEAKGLLPIQT